MDWGYIVMCQAYVENTKECLLPVCYKSYHMNNRFQQMWAEIKNLWNYAFGLV